MYQKFFKINQLSPIFFSSFVAILRLKVNSIVQIYWAILPVAIFTSFQVTFLASHYTECSEIFDVIYIMNWNSFYVIPSNFEFVKF